MLYTSELTGKSFSTEKECKEYESKIIKEQQEKREKAERLAREKDLDKKELECAKDDLDKALDRYNELKKEYYKKYGSISSGYHISSDGFFDLLSNIW